MTGLLFRKISIRLQISCKHCNAAACFAIEKKEKNIAGRCNIFPTCTVFLSNTRPQRMNRAIFQTNILPIRHKLYRFALRITGHTQEAEDVVQEVLEKVWKSSEAQTQAVNNWEAWCMTLTRNRSLDKSRAVGQRRTASLQDVQEFHAPTLNPAQQAESEDTVAFVKRLMQQLPEKQRLVIHLRDVEEQSYEEIAETLNISLDQVKINLHRARKSIRDALGFTV